MSDAEMSLIPEFEPPAREAWLALVQKVLKGGDFDKRLVSRTADGLAVQPLYTRADAIEGARLTARTAYFPGGWDIRQRHAEPDARAANAAILDDLTGGADLADPADPGAGPGRPPLRRRSRLRAALKGVFLDGCAIALDARENTMDAAGSLIEMWRERGIGENQRRGAFNFDPLGVLASDRHALLSGPALLRHRRQVRQRLPHHDQRHGAAGRRPALSRGRCQRGAGAGGDAGDPDRLPARLRGARAQTTLRPQQDRARLGGRRRPLPHHRQVARRAQARRPRRRGVRGHPRRRPHARVGRPRRSA